MPDETPEGIYAAGAVAGHESTAARPRPPARSPARRPRSRSSSESAEDRARLEADRSALAGARPGAAPGRARRPETGKKGKCFACLCEDVTTKDITYSIEEGYDSIELCKRYTTLTMGPCQGRMCQLAVDPQDGRGHRLAGRRGRADHRAAALVDACRWARWPGGPSSPPSAPPSTAATASWAAT